jgi:nucleoporin POM152
VCVIHPVWTALTTSFLDGSSSAPRTIPALSNVLSSVGLGALVSASSSSNLLGQHTVRMSPVSTAELNADGYRFCLSPHNSPLLIPVLLNNTNPTVLRYSLTPLDGSDDKIEYFDVNPREMRLADSSMSHEQHSGAVTSPPSEEDEYDDDDAAEEKGPALQKTQAVAHIPVTRPGILRLERVTHSNSVDARLAYPTSLVIAPCPSAAFMSDQHSVYSFTRCSGSNEDAHTNIEISGVPPLSLQYSKHHKYTVEHFDVEGIDGNHHVRHRSNTPQTIQIPLDLITGAAGTHIYVLDSVTDGLGNQVFLGDSTSALIKREAEHPGSIAAEKSTYARSIHVLSRPQLAFDRCSSSNPAQLLKGQEVALALLASNVDPQDWPLEAIVTYEPIVVNDGKDNHDKASTTADQGWTRTLQIDGKNSRIQAGSPGVYILRSAHGKNCEAEILNPDRCPIVELTRPSADIEWSRIHEW